MSKKKIEQSREIRLWIKTIVGGVVALNVLCPGLMGTVKDAIKLKYIEFKNKVDDKKAKLEQ